MALFSRWYVIALVVGVVMGVLPVLLGVSAMWLGNALNACNESELGCLLPYVVGVLIAPFEAVCGTLAAGVVSHRLRLLNSLPTNQRWKSCFGAGVLALFPAGLLAMATFGWLSR